MPQCRQTGSHSKPGCCLSKITKQALSVSALTLHDIIPSIRATGIRRRIPTFWKRSWNLSKNHTCVLCIDMTWHNSVHSFIRNQVKNSQTTLPCLATPTNAVQSWSSTRHRQHWTSSTHLYGLRTCDSTSENSYVCTDNARQKLSTFLFKPELCPRTTLDSSTTLLVPTPLYRAYTYHSTNKLQYLNERATI